MAGAEAVVWVHGSHRAETCVTLYTFLLYRFPLRCRLCLFYRNDVKRGSSSV